MVKFFMCLVLLCLSLTVEQTQTATVFLHHPATVLSAYPEHVEHIYQPGYTIVAPLTKIAHVTYDSVPISHTPYEHVPLFQRIGHVKRRRF